MAGPSSARVAKIRRPLIAQGPAPAAGVTPPSLRPVLLGAMPEGAEQPPYAGGLAWVLRAGAPGPATPPTLRPPAVVVAEDTLSPSRPAEAFRQGGLPNGPVTPPTLRPVYGTSAEDTLTPPRKPEAVLLGGMPNAPVTPPSPRAVLTGTAAEVPTPAPAPWLAVVALPPPTPKVGVAVLQPVVVPAEDVLSPVPPPSALYGGLPSGPVTAPTLRAAVVCNAEDWFSWQRHPEALLFGCLVVAVPPAPAAPVRVKPARVRAGWGPQLDFEGKTG